MGNVSFRRASTSELEVDENLESNSDEEEEAELDSKLWKELPSELLDRVLTKLPITSLMSFCRVSKRWKTLIRSVEFGRQCDSTKPVALFSYSGGYDEDDRIIEPYIAFPNATAESWEMHTLGFRLYPRLIAADLGLLCFFFLILRVNKIVGLIVDPETGNYKLVVGFIQKIRQDIEEGLPRGTHVYDSISSSWTSTTVYPEFPLPPVNIDSEEEHPYRTILKPGLSTRCGDNLYWMVGERVWEFEQKWELYSRILMKYDVKAGSWTVDEPNVPYESLVGQFEVPDCLPRNLPYAHLALVHPQQDIKLPRWNFHLFAFDGSVYVTLFDSLISRDAYSGCFSSLIPEVKVINPRLVHELLRSFYATNHYLPTRIAAQNEMLYILFEYDGVCRGRRRENPLHVLAYDSVKNHWDMLPSLDPESSCRSVLRKVDRPSRLPRLVTFAASFKAFV
ncbi:hypothetical protein R1sor_026581 [Riccia sorocarpa]|uniref:F-box domain-containing protein n=1 Tax=Riccia sorocarpa TaxID=122646 RepID=A0ABD3GBS1_9MARC